MHIMQDEAEAAFNLRLNNHRKNTKKPNSILACKHIHEKGHNFKFQQTCQIDHN